jgi:alkanesulfonate monooxygenase SsuD/methylene tetrahydromethanopterin reductase-like flavin-dependent oxidoreductase (luciferase family)
VLAAIAQATKRIRLTSAVTILSTADPVRTFEEFATLNLLSHGRAEMIAGRGVFVESFPLFGFDLADYDDLFAEKIELFIRLAASERATWSGRFRSPLDNSDISPRPLRPLPLWVGTGGTPASAERAGSLGLPLMMANISKPPAQLAPAIAAYRAAGAAAGHPASTLKVGVAAHLHVHRDSQRARVRFYPHYAAYFGHHTPDRYRGREISRTDYDQLAGAHGALFVGSPQQIVDKILYERELFGHDRFLAQIDIGGLPFADVADVIELIAADVMPALRQRRDADAVSA